MGRDALRLLTSQEACNNCPPVNSRRRCKHQSWYSEEVGSTADYFLARPRLSPEHFGLVSSVRPSEADTLDGIISPGLTCEMEKYCRSEQLLRG